MKHLFAIMLLCIFVSGCSALPQPNKEQNQAYKELQKAQTVVTIKTNQLKAAKAIENAAVKGVIDAEASLSTAEHNYNSTRIDFCEVLDCSFPNVTVDAQPPVNPG